MSIKNSEYWKKRFELLEAATNKEAASVYQDIEKQFVIAQKELEAQIQTWYSRFATNNQISMAEARRQLTTKELAEFKWDVKEYIKYGEQIDLNPAWMKQLENASARFHVSRLEALKIQNQQTIEVLYGNQLDSVDKLLKRTYLDGYYHTAYEIQKGLNVGWDIAAVSESQLTKIISKPWAADGSSFSSNIWSNRSELMNEVNTQLTRTVMLGKPPDDAIKAIAKKFGTNDGKKITGMKYKAARVVMTESAYFASASQKDAFNELDVERFEVVETLDVDTCELCGAMDGTTADMKDFQPGVTAPPFHPFCRGCTVPAFDDNFGERVARGEDGTTYYVPSDTKFSDWKKTFVDGGSKDGLQKVSENDIMKNKQDEIQALKNAIMDKHESILQKEEQKAELDLILSKHSSDELNLYDKLSDYFGSNDYHYRKSGAAYYPGEKKVLMDIDLNDWEREVETGQTGAWNTKFHEEFHQLDHMLSQTQFATQPDGTVNPFKNQYTHFTGTNTVIGQRMIKAIDDDILTAINNAVDWRNEQRVASGMDACFFHAKTLDRLNVDTKESLLYYLKDKYNTPKTKAQIDMFTDAMGLTTKDRLSPHKSGFWGHDSAYNKDRGKDGATSETWATFGSLFYIADDETKAAIQKLMPNTWNVYSSILQEVIEYALENDIKY